MADLRDLKILKDIKPQIVKLSKNVKNSHMDQIFVLFGFLLQRRFSAQDLQDIVEKKTIGKIFVLFFTPAPPPPSQPRTSKREREREREGGEKEKRAENREHREERAKLCTT